MFYYKLANHYFDTLNKRFYNYDEIKNKKRFMFKDKSYSVDILKNIRELNHEDDLDIIFTVTTRCNLNCNYCFERDTDRITMSNEEIEANILYLKKYIVENKITNLHLALFGGEPILEKEKVLFIVNDLFNFAKGNNIFITFSIITNGITFDEKLFELLKCRNVETVQVTLDGSEHLNNKIRKVKANSNINVYKEVLNNIDRLCRYFGNVNIKYNLNMKNLSEFNEFVKDLRLYIKDENFSKITVLLEALQTPNEEIYKFNYNNNDVALADAYINAIKILIKYRIRYRTKVFNTPCMATSYNSYLIDPSGGCSVCISNFKENNLYLGKFKEISKEYSKVSRRKLCKYNVLRLVCKNCDFLPACMGGCHYQLLIDGKDIYKDVNCRKNFYERFVDRFYSEVFLEKGINKIE